MPERHIPYGRQWIDDEDIAAVVEVLKSDWLTSGPKLADFENALAASCGAKYAVAVSSGTAALHIAYLATGLQAGDSIITSPMTFAATANTALYCGASVDFVDIEPDTGNIDAAKIDAAVNSSTRIIAPVHYAGQPADMAAIRRTANKYNLFVVEDACHALGAEYSGGKIGSCQYSDMTVFSFHPVKQITTGEGGALTTNNKALYEQLLLLRSHGISTDSDRPWIKDMQRLGYNFRMTDIQAALGLSQLKKLDGFLERRRQIAKLYDELLDGTALRPLTVRPENKHAYHLYPVLLVENIDRDAFYSKAYAAGIGIQCHYTPVYRHQYYQKQGYSAVNLPQAEYFAAHIVSLPIYPQLSDDDVRFIVRTLL